MLSIEIRVNGNPVGIITAYRQMEEVPSGGIFNYPYRAVFFGIHLDETPQRKNGSVTHYYDDGIAILCEKILGDFNPGT